MRNERGSVLLHVILMAALAGIICTAILRSRMQPALAAANTVSRIQDDMTGQSAINRVSGVWGSRGTCASDSAAGVSCSGSGCSCRCTVDGGATVTSVSAGGGCTLTAAAP